MICICHTKVLLQSNWFRFTIVEIRWILFAEKFPNASAERFSTVSGPYMVFSLEMSQFIQLVGQKQDWSKTIIDLLRLKQLKKTSADSVVDFWT